MKIISQLNHLIKLLSKFLTISLKTCDLYVEYFGFLPAISCCVILFFWDTQKKDQYFHLAHNLLSFNIVLSLIDAFLGISQVAVHQAPLIGIKALRYLQYNFKYLASHREACLLVFPLYSCGYFMFKLLYKQEMTLQKNDVASDAMQKPHGFSNPQALKCESIPSKNGLDTKQKQLQGKHIFINDVLKKEKEPDPYAKLLKKQNKTSYKSLKPTPTTKFFDNVPEVAREFQSKHKAMLDVIENLLKDFDIPASVSKCVVGYSVIIFAIDASKRIKLEVLKKIEPDLSSALGEQAKIAEYNSIGIPLCIEVPNKDKVTLRMSQVLNKIPSHTSLPPLSFTLGITLSGEVHRVQIDDLPHLLIAGTTGSGKSVCLHTIITGLMLTTPITSYDFVMIDPKVIELNFYSKLPNLLMPIIHDHQDANLALLWIIEEMERRYTMLSKFNVRNIKEYNKHHTQLHRPQELKSIILIIDEFGDLVLDKSNNFSNLLIKLAQKSRAAGIHIILTTQRPSANVVTGLLKANIPSRIAMQVSSKIESRIILDHNGAEALKGNGDLLFYRPGTPVIRLQSPYISPQEITKLAEFWS